MLRTWAGRVGTPGQLGDNAAGAVEGGVGGGGCGAARTAHAPIGALVVCCAHSALGDGQLQQGRRPREGGEVQRRGVRVRRNGEAQWSPQPFHDTPDSHMRVPWSVQLRETHIRRVVAWVD